MEARRRTRRVVGRTAALAVLVALLLGMVLASPVAPAGAAPAACAEGPVAEAGACPPAPAAGVLARTSTRTGLGALGAVGLTLVAIGAVVTGERRRPRRRRTDPRTRDRIASLIDRTP